MSTYNIGFYEELTKIILQLLSNTVLICSPADSGQLFSTTVPTTCIYETMGAENSPTSLFHF